VSYGTDIPTSDGNTWRFVGTDQLLPYVGDFDGDGVKDVAISSNGFLGALRLLGNGFQLVAVSNLANSPIASPDRVMGVGRFDHQNGGTFSRFLFKNPPDPPAPPSGTSAVLTYHNEPGRSGLNSQETWLTVNRVSG